MTKRHLLSIGTVIFPSLQRRSNFLMNILEVYKTDTLIRTTIFRSTSSRVFIENIYVG